MEFDYAQARATAEKIISKFGVAGAVIKKGSIGGNDEWGDPIADIPDVTIDGIVTPFMAAKKAEIDDTNVLMGDGFVFFHSDIAPEIGMQTTLNGQTYRIVNMKVLNSVDDINIYRKLQLRI